MFLSDSFKNTFISIVIVVAGVVSIEGAHAQGDLSVLKYEVDLYRQRNKDNRGKSQAQILAEIENDIQALEALPMPQDSERSIAVPFGVMNQVISAKENHPVVGFAADNTYNRRPVTDIGYCFGRATYAHLLGILIGVDPKAIRKAYIVGPMRNRSNDTRWAFHVTTIYRGPDGQWYAVDRFTNHRFRNDGIDRPLSLREWYRYFLDNQSEDGKLRLYVTPPERFSVSVGGYDRIQLGLDLGGDRDWYKDYFDNLLKEIRIEASNINQWVDAGNDPFQYRVLEGGQRIPLLHAARYARMQKEDQCRNKLSE